MEAPDANTVVFTLSSPYGGFADILSDRQVKIVPRGQGRAVAHRAHRHRPVPLRVLHARATGWCWPSTTTTSSRACPSLGGVELRIIPEMSAKLAALQSGDLDVVWDLPLDQVKTLQGRAGLRVESVSSGSWDAAIMNNTTAPFNDPRVRLAFQMAVDKADVVETVLFGQGVAHHQPDPADARRSMPSGLQVPAGRPGRRAQAAGRGRPPERRAACRSSCRSAAPVRERLGVALQQLAKPGGFDLQVQRVPFSSFDAEVSGKAALYIDGYFARPTVDTSTFPFLHSDRKLERQAVALQQQGGGRGAAGRPPVRRRRGAEGALPWPCRRRCWPTRRGFFAYAVNFACAYREGVTGVKTHPMRWFDLRQAAMA